MGTDAVGAHIAARAGVTAETVYNQFGTKSEPLAAVLDPGYRGKRGPGRGRLLTDNRRRRRADQRHLVGALVATGHLRSDLDADHAADVVFGPVNDDVYLLLTVDCGWSRKRFTRWLGETLLDQLVAAPDAPRVGRRPRPAS